MRQHAVSRIPSAADTAARWHAGELIRTRVVAIAFPYAHGLALVEMVLRRRNSMRKLRRLNALLS
jgi:hypothetical protein